MKFSKSFNFLFWYSNLNRIPFQIKNSDFKVLFYYDIHFDIIINLNFKKAYELKVMLDF